MDLFKIAKLAENAMASPGYMDMLTSLPKALNDWGEFQRTLLALSVEIRDEQKVQGVLIRAIHQNVSPAVTTPEFLAEHAKNKPRCLACDSDLKAGMSGWYCPQCQPLTDIAEKGLQHG